jgi:hypothetical protein
MVFDNFNLEGVSIPPLETNPPLVVDADAILTFPVARELFEPVYHNATHY